MNPLMEISLRFMRGQGAQASMNADGRTPLEWGVPERTAPEYGTVYGTPVAGCRASRSEIKQP